jgi:uncharacterized membrane protein
MARLGLSSILALFLVLLGCSDAMERAGIFSGVVKRPQVGVLQNFGEKTVSFEVVRAVSLRNCLECHTTGDHAINTEALVLAHKDDILSEIRNKTMPPRNSGYPLLNECETKILETWIDDKLSHRESSVKVNEIEACANVGAPVTKPKTDFAKLPLNFENLKREILAPKCLQCHAKDSPGYQYNLEDLQDIKDNELVAATPEESTLFKVVNKGMTKIFMPKKSSGIKPLTRQEIDYMKRWIEAGAL